MSDDPMTGVEIADVDPLSLDTPLTHDDIDRLVENLPADLTLTPVADIAMLDDEDD